MLLAKLLTVLDVIFLFFSYVIKRLFQLLNQQKISTFWDKILLV